MKPEETLSEHIVDDPRSAHVGYIHAPWVKEFIKKLKELVISMKRDDSLQWNMRLNIINEDIDKLAGEELVK